MELNDIIEKIRPIDKKSAAEAQDRFDNLIKPVGSLAKLETMVSRYAGMLGCADKSAVQYPKKALLLWGTELESIADAMQHKLPVTFLADEAGIQTYPMPVVAANIADALEEGVLLTREYLEKNKLQMLAFGALNSYDLGSCQEQLWDCSGFEFLEKLHDRTVAAIAGGILQAAAARVPVMLDGTVSCLGALVAAKIAPLAAEYCMAGHISAEPGMEKLLDRLGITAPLRLEINSGAGEGAIFACTLFDAGIKAYNEMETFEEAGVHAEVEEFSHAVQEKAK